MGFKHGASQKSYYVDGHEHEAQKEHRSKFTNKYLTELEPCTFRYVQLTIPQYEAMQAKLAADKKNLILHKGFKFPDPVTHEDKLEFLLTIMSVYNNMPTRQEPNLVDISVFVSRMSQNHVSSSEKTSPYSVKTHSIISNGYHQQVRKHYFQRVVVLLK